MGHPAAWLDFSSNIFYSQVPKPGFVRAYNAEAVFLSLAVLYYVRSSSHPAIRFYTKLPILTVYNLIAGAGERSIKAVASS